MMEENDREILIQYRLTQAEETIAEVRKLIDAELLNVAVNRIYYGMFYSITALALKHEFQSSKHSQLMGWFNQNFVKPGLIDTKYGKILRDAYKNRSDGDYAPFIRFEQTDVQDMLLDMIDFIGEINLYISKQK